MEKVTREQFQKDPALYMEKAEKEQSVAVVAHDGSVDFVIGSSSSGVLPVDEAETAELDKLGYLDAE
ncbi:hypothetical protein [Nonomuraea sp. NPDC050643]|uniref:hypothetical protein n=1 Tax=Nonomuraea sp. NPDC050643 TaxID=3155660 RepID=UPI0033C656D2